LTSFNEVNIFTYSFLGKGAKMTKKKKGGFLILLIFISLFPGSVLGQETEEKKKEKEKEKESISRLHREIVVTATMTRKAVKDCSASVSIVEAGDLGAISSSNAMNLLSHQPGIFIRRTGDFGRADVDIRGLGYRGGRIAILVDGRPEKMGLFGCAVTHAFPLDNVERIEVVRGPSSVFYGSEALGGVVNIITHTPENKFETDLSASYGSFDTLQLNFRHGGNFKKLNYYFTLDRRSSDGHIENSSYSGDAFTGKVSYDISKRFQVKLQGKYFKGKKYEAGPEEFPLTDFWNDYERGAVDLSLEGNGEKDEFFMKLYRNFGHHQFSNDWNSRDYTNGGVIRYTTHRITNNELTVGADFRFLGGKSYNFPKGSWEKNDIAVFLHDEHVLWEKLILSSGVRFHRDSIHGYEISPHWGFVLQVNEKTSLRGTINKGFRSPQLSELYMFPIANPDLEPERVWNYEIGFEQKFGRSIIVNGAVFRMNGSNFIETLPNPSPPPPFKYMNSGKFTFYGAELSTRVDFSKDLSVLAFYSFLDPGEKTQGRPGHKFDLSLRLRKKIFSTSLQAQYVADYFADNFSANPLPSYFILSSRLIVHTFRFLDIFIDINNIFNENYKIFVELPGIGAGSYPMPGRSLNLGIKIKQ
jgi:iron complex outermembrane receptor protein